MPVATMLSRLFQSRNWDQKKSLGANLYTFIAAHFYWFGSAVAMMFVFGFAVTFGLALNYLVNHYDPYRHFINAYNAANPDAIIQVANSTFIDAYNAAHPNATIPEHAILSIYVMARSVGEQAHGLVRRGWTSPSPNELLINSIGFGVPATLFFIMRM
jgi:hypothetical protein